MRPIWKRRLCNICWMTKKRNTLRVQTASIFPASPKTRAGRLKQRQPNKVCRKAEKRFQTALVQKTGRLKQRQHSAQTMTKPSKRCPQARAWLPKPHALSAPISKPMAAKRCQAPLPMRKINYFQTAFTKKTGRLKKFLFINNIYLKTKQRFQTAFTKETGRLKKLLFVNKMYLKTRRRFQTAFTKKAGRLKKFLFINNIHL